MAARIRPVEYFHAIIEDRPGEAYQLLRDLASAAIDLLAFNAVPLGRDKTELVVFPEDPALLGRAAEKIGLSLKGPHRALLIQGDDELGALLDLHGRLADAHVNVMASCGVSDGRGGYGYVVYVREDHFREAVNALGV